MTQQPQIVEVKTPQLSDNFFGKRYAALIALAKHYIGGAKLLLALACACSEYSY